MKIGSPRHGCDQDAMSEIQTPHTQKSRHIPDVFVFNQAIFWDLTSDLVTREGLRLLRGFAQDSLSDFQTLLDGHSLRWSDTYGTRVGCLTPEAEAAYRRIYDRIETLGISPC